MRAWREEAAPRRQRILLPLHASIGLRSVRYPRGSFVPPASAQVGSQSTRRVGADRTREAGAGSLRQADEAIKERRPPAGRQSAGNDRLIRDSVSVRKLYLKTRVLCL